jgi:steroid delta-isomerase-like uncharacterized protein
MAEALDAARRHIEAFNAHDLDAHMANEAADIEWVQPGGISLRGPEQVAELQRILWEAMPDATVTPVNQVAAGSTVVTESELSGTHTGTFRSPVGDTPPSGNRVKLRYVSVQRVAAGKIASEHLYFDQLEFLTQIGAISMPSTG